MRANGFSRDPNSAANYAEHADPATKSNNNAPE